MRTERVVEGAELVGRGPQRIKVMEVVRLGEKAGLGIIPMQHDVLGHARQMKSRFPWHRIP